MESLGYQCRPCGVSFRQYEELEKHYIQSHLDMSNERPKKGHSHIVPDSR